MSSRDRDTKSLQDKLKVFFKKGASAPLPAVNELVVTAELERELRADAAPARRLRALRDLGDRVRVTRIQQGGAERLWALMRDLLDDGCAESRHTALWFLRCIAEGQECAVMRTVMFRYLRESHAQHAAEDAPHRLSLLSTLTNAGKNIECFEEQVGEYLLEYMRSVGETGPALPELLALVINVVKYNATYLDEHVVHGIVDASCHLCAYSASAGAVVSALALLEAVVAYSLLPRAALPAFVGALCRTVNLERHCQTSWKLMRSVLGADLGHAALQELAALPAAAANNAAAANTADGSNAAAANTADGSNAAAANNADAGAVRGAVFYINMALWGPRRVPSLRVSLLCVLPALLQAVSTNQPVVTYEVIQAIQSLVSRAPPDSLCAAWDVLLAVLAHAHRHDKSLDPPNELIHTRLHALLTCIEQLHEAGQYTGDTGQLLDLIDCSAQDRPEASVLRLITLRCSTLSPARADWLAAALALGDKFVRRDTRLGVRMHALQQLLAVVKRHRFLYEEEVVVGVGVPLLSWCGAGAGAGVGVGVDPALRAAAARAAAELAVLVTGDAATDLIDLLEKVPCGQGRAAAELAVLVTGDAATDLIDLLEKVPCGQGRAAAELAVLVTGDAATDLIDLLEKVPCGQGRAAAELAVLVTGDAATDLIDLLEKVPCGQGRAAAELAVLVTGDAATDLIDLLEKVPCGQGRAAAELAVLVTGDAATDLIDLLEKVPCGQGRAAAELAVLVTGDAATDLIDLLEKVPCGQGRAAAELAVLVTGDAATDLIDLLEKVPCGQGRAAAELAVLVTGDAATDLIDLLEKVPCGQGRAAAELAVLVTGDAATDLIDLLEKVPCGQGRAAAELAVLVTGDAATDLIDLLEKVPCGQGRAAAELAVLVTGDAATDLIDLLEKVPCGQGRAAAELAVLVTGDAATDLIDLLEKVPCGQGRAAAELAVLVTGDAATDLIDLLEKVPCGQGRAAAELAVLVTGDAATDLIDLLEKVPCGQGRAAAELAVLVTGDAATDLIDLLEKVPCGQGRAAAELAVLVTGDAATDLIDLLEKVPCGQGRAAAELAVLVTGDAATDLIDLLEKVPCGQGRAAAELAVLVTGDAATDLIDLLEKVPCGQGRAAAELAVLVTGDAATDLIDLLEKVPCGQGRAAAELAVLVTGDAATDLIDLLEKVPCGQGRAAAELAVLVTGDAATDLIDLLEKVPCGQGRAAAELAVLVTGDAATDLIDLLEKVPCGQGRAAAELAVLVTGDAATDLIDLLEKVPCGQGRAAAELAVLVTGDAATDLIDLLEKVPCGQGRAAAELAVLVTGDAATDLIDLLEKVPCGQGRAAAELAVLVTGDAATDLIDLLEKVPCGQGRAAAELAVLVTGDAATDLIDLLEKVPCGQGRAAAELAVLVTGDAATDLIDLLEKVPCGQGRAAAELAVLVTGDAATDLIDLLEKVPCGQGRAAAELAVLVTGDAATDLIDLLEKVPCGQGRAAAELAVLVTGDAATDLIDLLEKVPCGQGRAAAELAVLVTGDAATDLIDLLEKVPCGQGRAAAELAVLVTGDAATDLIDLLEKVPCGQGRAAAELAVLVTGDAATDLIDLLEKVPCGQGRAAAELAVLVTGDAATDLIDLLEKVPCGQGRAAAELAVLVTGDAATDLIDLLEKVPCGQGRAAAELAVLVTGDAATDLIDLLEKVPCGQGRAAAELAVLVTGDAATDLIDLLEKVPCGQGRAAAELAVLVTGDAATDLIDLLEKVPCGQGRAAAELAVLVTGDAATDLIDLLEKVPCGQGRAAAELAVLVTGDAATDLIDLLEKVPCGQGRAAAELAVLVTGDAATDLIDLLEKVPCGQGRAAAELAVLVTGDAATDLIDLLEKVPCGQGRAAAELAVLVTGDAATDLIDLLEKIMNRPFEGEEPNESDPEPDLTDVTLAVSGLLEVFHAKLLRAPAAHAARACLVLLDHLDHALNHPRHSAQHATCRRKILDMIFGLRANLFNSVGFCYDGAGSPVYGTAALRIKPLCSPSLLAEPLAARGHHPPPTNHQVPGACILPVGRCARILTLALAREKEWSVLQHVLRALPALLQSRALCVGRRAQDLDLLASSLCAMLSDRSLAFPECLRGPKVLVSELHAAVLPSLGALAPYHAFLEPLTQQRVVRCLLRYGMVLRTPAPYLAALTQFTLEARDTMVKLLPEVLLDLSKVSDTKLIAGPMLEFLSTLTRLPRVFASFVEDQYMSVFAILLPYTNPSRYNHYVVSLAHHVVAAWFLKCRLSYRRNFVRFIIHGLHNYIIMPFEEQLHKYKVHAPTNEDSSNRKRSSSLGSRGVSAAPLGAGAGAARACAASASAAFHVELTETCVDLLARYTASACSVKPQRSDAAEWMFSGGHSMTWLVGHKLVTITTAGCNMNSIKQGMCDRCATLCRQHAESAASPLPPRALNASDEHAKVVPPSDGSHGQNHNNLQVTNPPEIKRYSKHSLQHSRSTDNSASSSLSDRPDNVPSSYSKHSLQHSRSTDNSASSSLSDRPDNVPSSYSKHSLQHSRSTDNSASSSLSDRPDNVPSSYSKHSLQHSRSTDNSASSSLSDRPDNVPSSYSKHSLQHSRSTDNSASSSLSDRPDNVPSRSVACRSRVACDVWCGVAATAITRCNTPVFDRQLGELLALRPVRQRALQLQQALAATLPFDRQLSKLLALRPARQRALQVSGVSLPCRSGRVVWCGSYSKHSLQHSRSTDNSASSSLSDRPDNVPSRQNSAEYNPIVDALNNFTQRFEKISKEVDIEEAAWSRAGELAAGACPCWCADWAEIHVRSPSGDVSWLMRVQNQMGWENQESSLQDILALLAPAPAPSSASSGVGDDRTNNASESESRSRSGSSASQAAHAQDLHKSSSDSVVAGGGERRPPHAASHCIGPPPQPQRMSTQPINIPGSPVRGAARDDDMLLYVPEGKSRHPVRRSNSSPEMSSWKLPRDSPTTLEPPAADPSLLILLPGTEPTQSQSLHASKKANKKSDMRVSCEAIPEEMSGSSPLAAPAPPPHPHLMTYNSDPGKYLHSQGGCSGSAPEDGPAPQPIQKVASDSIVQSVASAHLPAPAHAHKPPAAPAPSHPPPPTTVGSMKDRDDLPPLSRSKRSNTISVMSPTRRHRDQSSTMSTSSSGRSTASSNISSSGAGAGGGVTPSFVLLQLYHKMSTYPITPPVPGEVPSAQNPLAERPLLVSGVQHERTIKNLDRVPPIETYKVGVLYVGPGQQDNEVEVLKNEYGSVRYAEFLGQLGTLVSLAGSGAGLLEGAQQQPLFLNLEQGGKDGKYTYVWHDDIMQVLFHVATAMPVSAADPTCNEKRKYIGNDYVSIVYNDSGGDFPIQTIKGQFNLCIVVVEPCEHGLHRVHIKTKDERIRSKFLPHLENCAHVVSDHCAATLARQLALHCALASHISQSLSMGGGSAPYASNSLERLRHIKRLRRRVEEERLAQAARAPKPYAPQGDTARRVAMDDFNDYT
ncbi:uncharacterized protein LOC134743970 [Cydia strobilella]|uniref:uncharacterized protein LOC134743970 n=1 Tax=Cydia strobilella TaxID=1100964 RepID=UPI003005C337